MGKEGELTETHQLGGREGGSEGVREGEGGR